MPHEPPLVSPSAHLVVPAAAYAGLVTGISELLEHARRMSARSVNSILTATYWEIGRRIVEFEQGGKARAEYGEATLARLSKDLIAKHGRGFPGEISSECVPSTLPGIYCRQRRQNSKLGRECPQISGEATRYCRHRRQNSSPLTRDFARKKEETARFARQRRANLKLRRYRLRK